MSITSYAPQERAYYDRLFTAIDKTDSGVIPGQDALPFLVSSGLPQQTLGEVWAIADTDNNGFLTKDGWYKAARLIGHLQKGDATLDESLISKPGPYPTFSGQAPPPTSAPSPSSSSLPPITPSDRTKFTRIFVGCGPQNGLVAGDKARDVFVKSQLSYDKLGQIWNLADTQQRGSLDLTDFIIGMFLIQSCMANSALNLPATLPSGMYEQASGGRSMPTSPLSPQRTGSSLRPQYTGPSSPINPQRTGTAAKWDVTPEAKASSDQFFSQLDTKNTGMIEGDVAVPFMLQSQLDEGTLATIWDLADIKHEGKLDRDQFAVAMHLINAKLAGKDVPRVLPSSLIPPSLRGVAGAQEVITGPSSATKDLFDLFDDPPAPTSTFVPPKAFSPVPAARPNAIRSSIPSATQSPAPPPIRSPPPSDLLGDDDTEESSTPVTNASADIGNKQNELRNATRSLENVTQSRKSLEAEAASSQSQLKDLESRLSATRSNYEAETKTVADLRSRVAEQTAQIKKLNSEFISAESDVSALRSEKAELEQALMRDKEEIRGLQRKMKEVDEEKASLKSVLEKMRKESRQQKGMVTIAKKQLSTSETARDATQKEIDDAATQEAAPATSPANVPLPATPRALSPVATGLSQRSNNPFDRLNRVNSPPVSSPPHPETSGATSPSVGLVAGGAAAVAGLVAAGAETIYHAAKGTGSPEETGEQSVDDGESKRELSGKLSDEDTSPLGNKEVGPPEKTDIDDPFGMPSPQLEADPFGISDRGEDSGFSGQGFGDSFGATTLATETTPVAAAGPPTLPTASDAPSSDFDTAFDNFEKEDHVAPVSESHVSPGENVGQPAIASPPASASTSAPETKPESPPHENVEELASSDEEDGPEDLERPLRYHSPPPPALSPPVDTANTRRSPPAPPVRNITEELDPFGSSAPSAPSQSQDLNAHSSEPSSRLTTPPLKSSAPMGANFDDDDFDFSDVPPAAVDAASAAGPDPVPNQGGFDDEFAAFDDEFGSTQPPSGSENSNMTKSYEMVSPTPRPHDEWSVAPTQGASNSQPAPASAFSFDDAFGGDFEPTPAASQEHSDAPSTAPPLPQRTDSSAQNDDIEDVKKLCAMGFSRTLVIAALDANGYDFQKSLNVLLTQ